MIIEWTLSHRSVLTVVFIVAVAVAPSFPQVQPKDAGFISMLNPKSGPPRLRPRQPSACRWCFAVTESNALTGNQES